METDAAVAAVFVEIGGAGESELRSVGAPARPDERHRALGEDAEVAAVEVDDVERAVERGAAGVALDEGDLGPAWIPGGPGRVHGRSDGAFAFAVGVGNIDRP